MSDDKNTEFALWAMGIAHNNRQKELNKMPYNEYLKTDEWQRKRGQAQKEAGGFCQDCGQPLSRIPSDTHHKRYTTRGQEQPEDLMVLCRRCHEKAHGIK